MNRRRVFLVLACCAGFARAETAWGQGAADPGGGSVRIAYKNTPIARVVSDIARATGVSLIYDESVSALGTVTIEGPPQVSRAEALALLDSLLLLRGFAAIPGPTGARKIMAINGAPSPWRPSTQMPDSDAPITTMLRLESANATDIVPLLVPYLGTNSTAAAFEPTNSLIMSGPASLLRTLRTALVALDQEQAGQPLIWPMRVADAKTVADQLIEIAGDRDVPFATSDARRNALILRVRPGETERVRAIVDRLDRPAHGKASVQVVKLRYADPEQIAQTLISLRGGAGTGSSAATGGAGAGAASKRAGLRGLEFEAVADPPTHSLLVSAPPETIDAVLDVVEQLDRVPPSVRVEITIATIDHDDQLDLGMDYLLVSDTHPDPHDLIAAALVNPSGGGPPMIDTSRPIIAAFTRDPLLITVIDPVTHLPVPLTLRPGGTITLEGHTVHTDVMMRPNLLITSGDEHEIFAGDNVPIPVAHAGAAGTQGTSGGTETGSGTGTVASPTLTTQKNIERKDVGTTLRVTPTVGEKGGVTLELYVELSALRDSVAGDVEEVGPTIAQSVIESTIHLTGAGEIAVLATSGRPLVEKTETGIPWLKDIPVLGFAFRTTSDRSRQQHLLIAARAQILRPESHDLADRLGRALQPSGPATARP
jgi:general secretion pathway protein D